MDVRKEISAFLNELCRGLGICDPFDNLEYFLSKEYYEVDEFAREIMLAEGLDPDMHLTLLRKIKRRFIKRFECSEIYNLDRDKD